MATPAHRRCGEPHPSLTWKAPGAGLEPYRCVEESEHPGDHVLVHSINGDNPLGTEVRWPRSS